MIAHKHGQIGSKYQNTEIECSGLSSVARGISLLPHDALSATILVLPIDKMMQVTQEPAANPPGDV